MPQSIATIHLRKYIRSTHGNVAIITAVAMTALTGISGAAILHFQGLEQKTAIQAALDSGVLSGTALGYSSSDADRIAAAEAAFYANVEKGEFVPPEDSARFIAEGNLKPAFSVQNARVSGTAIARVENGLGVALGITKLEVKVNATAAKRMSDPVCVLALNEDQPAAIEVYGNAELNVNGCAVQANSVDGEGLKLYGNKSSASAKQFGVTGNFVGENWSPRPITGTDPVSDPFASLPVPEPESCTDQKSKMQSSNFVLSPGTFCGGLNIKGGAKVVLTPGIYIMQDGQFAVNSGAEVTGENVMIALVGKDSYLNLLSDASVKLTSPVTGTYTNIQFMSDRDLSQSKFEQEWSTVLSGATLEYDGVMYLPEQQFWVSGTAQKAVIKGSSPSMVMLTDKIWAQGNAVFELTRENKRGIGSVADIGGFAYGARLVR
jgi:hypothetical protein